MDYELRMNWIKLQAARIAILSYDMSIPIWHFFIDVHEKTGVMFTPSSTRDVYGNISFIYANALNIIEKDLIRFSYYVKKYAWQFIYYLDFVFIIKVPKETRG